MRDEFVLVILVVIFGIVSSSYNPTGNRIRFDGTWPSAKPLLIVSRIATDAN